MDTDSGVSSEWTEIRRHSPVVGRPSRPVKDQHATASLKASANRCLYQRTLAVAADQRNGSHTGPSLIRTTANPSCAFVDVSSPSVSP
jgi:hypothetical protein